MHCQNCQNLHFEPLDLVQKLVSAEKPLAQALGTTLAFTRKAIVKAGSTKKFGDRIIGTINSLPTSVKTNLSNPTGSAEVLHNSVCIVHQSLQALKLSAEYGCQFCRLLWGGLREPIASPKSKNHSSSSEVRLFLSAYRDINVEKSLSILTNQYIIAECGQDRSMCLDITAGSFESLRNDPSSKLRSTVLSRAVKGYPSKKVNSDGLPQINWSQIDPNRVHLKTVYNGNGNSSMQVTFDPGNKTRTQMIDSHFATMNSLSGSSGYARYIEGSQAEEDSHTGSRINLNKAIGWILGCEQSHELCARTIQSKSALPTRVIDLGPPRSNQVPYIYTSRGEFARYCTLSHRWGKNTILSTLKQNIEAHKLRLPLELMSSNFKDAIEVCRELCVRYLWIDSLCIIQDSREDWEEESAKMGDYYWNSFFTIAADHASDYYQGCFSRRDPYSIQPCNITFTFPHEIDRAIAEVRVAPRIQDGIDWRHKQYSILDTRSWVLQERVLSPRTLFFGEHQLTFCCITMRASESIPEGSDRTGANVQASFEEFQRKIRTFNAALQDGRPIDVTSNGAARTGTRTDMQTGEMVTSMEPEFNDKRQEQPKHLLELRSNWYELLVEYNKRSITQKSDVFPALSGLAQRFHKILGETYFAGIWSGDLIGGLLWSVDMNSQKGESYRAPSWSWACLRSCRLRFNCNYENVIGDPICRIFKVEVTTRTSNPYGEVVGGKLFVKGILKMARAVIPPAVVEHLANEVPDMDIRYGSVDDLQFREIGDGIDLEKGECAYLEDHESGEQLSKFEPDGLFDTSIDNGLVFCVPLLIQRNMFGNQAALCLVLQPIHLQSSRWKRVGFARMLKTEWFNGANAFPLTIE